jgi:hypothetical protein
MSNLSVKHNRSSFSSEIAFIEGIGAAFNAKSEAHPAPPQTKGNLESRWN